MPQNIYFTINNAISRYDSYGHAIAKKPGARDNEIFNFGRHFLGHHNNILTLYVLCLGEEKIFIEIMYFHYIT